MKTAPRRPPILHRTSLGALALTGASALRLGLQFAMLPILARLIGPAEYGLVSLAMPFILLANVLSDGGMGYALGREKEASPQLESTIFWFAGAIGAGLALFCCLAAYPMGWILGEERLPLLIMALSPILLMNGLTAVSNGRIIREGRFSVFAVSDVISTAASAVTALLCAMNGWGAWSLVAQQLVLWTCKLVFVTLGAKAVVRFYWRFAEARRLLKFGFSTIGATLSDFVSRNVDSMIVGGVLGTLMLGYYAMAYQIVRMPDMLISQPLYLYIFTAVARAAHDSERGEARHLAVSGLRLGAAALAPLFAGLALVADLAVWLVLGEKWMGAVAPLRWLAGAGFCFCMVSIMATTAMGLGRTTLQLIMSMVLGATTIVAVALFVQFGIEVVSAALFGAMGLVCGLYIHVLGKSLKARRRELVLAFLPAAVGAAAMAAVVLVARSALEGAHVHQVVELVTMVGLGGLSYLGVMALIARRQLIADARAFAHAQDDGPAPGSLPEVPEAAKTLA